jgi:hypothetical protein
MSFPHLHLPALIAIVYGTCLNCCLEEDSDFTVAVAFLHANLKAKFGSNCAEPSERNEKPLAEIASTGGNTNADYDCTINLEMRKRSCLHFGAGKCLHSDDTPP